MSSTLKRRKKLLLVTMTCILAEKHLRKKNKVLMDTRVA